MTNELTDVRCPCGTEFPADSYDAGFIAGSGMCQNCDAAMPPKDIPAPVEQAGGDERVIGWRERILAAHPNSDPGFWPDALLVEHMAAEIADLRAALAQPSPVRSSLLINGYQLRAALEFIAPDGTAEQLKSEACIEWRQQDADFLEAGLYAFCAEYPEEGGVLLDEEPTTAQPSPLQSEQAEAERPEMSPERATYFMRRFKSEEKLLGPNEQAAVDYVLSLLAQHDRIVGALRAEITQLRQHKNDYMDAGQETYRALQNEIRDREAEIARLDGLVSGRTAERDAALARVAELESKLAELEMQAPVAFLYRGTDMGDQLTIIRLDHYWRPKYSTEEHDYIKGIPLYAAPVAQAQHSVPELDQSRSALTEAQMRRLYDNSTEAENEQLGFAAFARLMRRAEAVHQIAAAPGKEVGHE